ncbi:MAG: hypothetical protein AAFY60_00365 [Myxococcota bacterium]
MGRWAALPITLCLWACAGDLGDSAPYLAALEQAAPSASETDTPLDPCGIGSAPPAFLSDEARCGGCHNASSTASANLDLVSPDVATRVAGVAAACPQGLLADPADPEASTLVLWTRDGTLQCEAPSMPPIGAPLNMEELECLIRWIDGLDGVTDRVSGGTAQ